MNPEVEEHKLQSKGTLLTTLIQVKFLVRFCGIRDNPMKRARAGFHGRLINAAVEEFRNPSSRQPFVCGKRRRVTECMHERAIMDEDALNTSIRQFLKTFGVSAQREIEKAVRDADSKGELTDSNLRAKAVLTVSGIDLKFEIEHDIALA